ncbi:Ankyrin_repeat-containing protein [Hexamita inflata]|uniref:Ankyrin repeat-containing protein n=1 Tax=Hexamita inflata TaxID=28002 RepID=A0AA86U0S5_9EUKA|nr:Ankyrin repeat-containing protein [Hexamita inflata]
MTHLEWFKACKLGNLQIVEDLFHQYKQSQNEVGQTGLMLAAQKGWIHIIEYLIDVESGIGDNHNKTALMYATEENRIDAIKILIVTEIGIKNHFGHYAIDYACSDIAEFLLRHEKQPNLFEVQKFIDFTQQKTFEINAMLNGYLLESRTNISSADFVKTQLYYCALGIEKSYNQIKETVGFLESVELDEFKLIMTQKQWERNIA